MAYNCFVFIPAFGHVLKTATHQSVLKLQAAFFQKGIGAGFSNMSFPDIAELRAMAMTLWYDTMPNVSHMLFIDSDMGFEPQLVLDMFMFDEPLVGTLYPQRRLPTSWAGSGNGQPFTARRGDFMLVEGVGFGCTLMRRDVVTAMLEKFPELVDTRLALHPAGDMLRQAGVSRLIRAFEKMDIPDRGLVSEDLSFCIRAAQCGIQTWAAIGHRISHVGDYDYNGRFLDVIEQAQAQMQIPQPAPLVQTLQDVIVRHAPPMAGLYMSGGGAAVGPAATPFPDDAPGLSDEKIDHIAKTFTEIVMQEAAE